MYSIFYDLETSDQNCVGQILNFAFVAYDSDWNIVDQLTGEIKIGLLQLPRAGAILANRINVLQHQKQAQFNEPEAMCVIADFLSKIAKQSKGTPALIGYNSAGFDLKYLRTSLIRNGINPYEPSLIHRDLFLASRHLAVTNSKFVKTIAVDAAEKYSLGLERMCQRFNLLQGKQLHESLADVNLTADLAKTYKEKFGLDIRCFEGYQAESGLERGLVLFRLEPDYEADSETRIQEKPYMFLVENDACSMWVDLQRFSKGQGLKSLVYRRKKTGDLVVRFGHVTEELKSLADLAHSNFKDFKVQDYFQKTTCDIEQDIYRVDSDEREALRRAIWENDLRMLAQVSNRSRNARVLFLRHQLTNSQELDSEKYLEGLKKYASYRYGGQMQLTMFLEHKEEQKSAAKETFYEVYHPTFQQLLAEIDEKLLTAEGEDRELLEALREFYLSSKIASFMG